MVAVEMRDQHDIDLLGIDAGRFHIAARLPDQAFAAGEGAESVAGVDGDQLGTGVDDHRAERDGHLPVRHIGRGRRLDRLILAEVDDETIRHREGAGTVAQLDDLVVTHFITEDAGAFGRWRGRERVAPHQRHKRARRGERGRAGEHFAAGQLHHVVSPCGYDFFGLLRRQIVGFHSTGISR